MSATSQRQKTVLVTGANGYIGEAVARAFQRAGFATYGLIRSSRSTTTLEKHSIIPIIGSAAQCKDTLAAIKTHTDVLDIIASTTEDRNDYVPHFEDTMIFFRELSKLSNSQGVRPIVLFTSGCKDYGQGGLDGSPDLVLHTEESPIRPPPFLVDRATNATRVFQEDLFDSTVLRPTHVHGGLSSHLGDFFQVAAEAKQEGRALQFHSDPRTIIHSMNVNDCGEAYVALAEHSNRAQIAGECFNISAGDHYETLGDIGDALVKLYQIEEGIVFNTPETAVDITPTNALTNFSQFVGSGKLRELTGWSGISPMFAQDISRYWQEYEDATSAGS